MKEEKPGLNKYKSQSKLIQKKESAKEEEKRSEAKIRPPLSARRASADVSKFKAPENPPAKPESKFKNPYVLKQGKPTHVKSSPSYSKLNPNQSPAANQVNPRVRQNPAGNQAPLSRQAQEAKKMGQKILEIQRKEEESDIIQVISKNHPARQSAKR